MQKWDNSWSEDKQVLVSISAWLAASDPHKMDYDLPLMTYDDVYLIVSISYLQTRRISKKQGNRYISTVP